MLLHNCQLKMITTTTNTNPTTPTNTYFSCVKTGSSYNSAPVINAQNPDRERRTKQNTGAKKLLA